MFDDNTQPSDPVQPSVPPTTAAPTPAPLPQQELDPVKLRRVCILYSKTHGLNEGQAKEVLLSKPELLQEWLNK